MEKADIRRRGSMVREKEEKEGERGEWPQSSFSTLVYELEPIMAAAT